MDKKIICKKVSSLLSLYIDNKVTDSEKEFIETHLNECEICYNKYIYLKSLIKSLKDSYKQIVELSLKKQKQECFIVREHEKFRENMSPYIDNELDVKECYEFRKHLTKSKTAQKELKNAYRIQKELKNSFEKTKQKVSNGISKRVIQNLKMTNTKKSEQFLYTFFNFKIAKIAILLGIFILGGYEIFNNNKTIKYKTEPTIKNEYITKSEYKTTESKELDFIEF